MPQGQPAPYTGSSPAYTGLNAREAEFCENYLISYDAGEAGRAMGLKRSQNLARARALLREPKISKAIEARKAELIKASGVYVEQIRDEARKIAFFDIGRIFKVEWEPVLDEKGNPVCEKKINERGEHVNGEPKLRKVILLRDFDEIDTAALAGCEITNTPDGPRIKVRTHDKLRALELIGKDAGAFRDDSRPLPNVTFNFNFPNGHKAPKVVNPRGGA